MADEGFKHKLSTSRSSKAFLKTAVGLLGHQRYRNEQVELTQETSNG
jgi:hypothetical protein